MWMSQYEMDLRKSQHTNHIRDAALRIHEKMKGEALVEPICSFQKSTVSCLALEAPPEKISASAPYGRIPKF